jgi:hypothetical protein
MLIYKPEAAVLVSPVLFVLPVMQCTLALPYVFDR